jgi:predicted cupin superfamily sugar epimerase
VQPETLQDRACFTHRQAKTLLEIGRQAQNVGSQMRIPETCIGCRLLTGPHRRQRPRYRASRSFSTAIYYLLTPDSFSMLHRLKSDELFHFYLGDSVTMLQFHPEGRAETITLGQDVAAGRRLQVVVPAGVWQGSFLSDGGRFALMGCTVAPGFDFDDFELGERKELIEQYPDRSALIERLTPGHE